MPDPLYVLFACNDPETGEPTGRVTGIDLWDAAETETALELVGEEKFRARESESLVILGVYGFPVLEPLADGVGTLEWSAAHMDPGVVAEMLEYLRGTRRWRATGGLPALGWQFQRFTAATLAEALALEASE